MPTSNVLEVVSNTSPFLYLHQLKLLHLLPAMYGEVIAPGAVDRELREGAVLGYDVPDLAQLDWVRIEVLPAEQVLQLAPDLGQESAKRSPSPPRAPTSRCSSSMTASLGGLPK